MHRRQSNRVAAAALQPSGANRWFVFVLLSLIMLAAATATTLIPAAMASAQTGTAEVEPADIVEQVNASAVTVYTFTSGGIFSPGQTGLEPAGAGSGWVYSNDGLVVTNAHVVDGAEEVRVVLEDGTIIHATVLGSDWYQDVAVLQLQPESGQDYPPAATVGDSSLVRAGDQVIAIGTPLGQFANTVSVGNVGATNRALNTETGYSLLNLIQHDASLSPGNSGGPLFSMHSEVIGMNVAKVESLNMSDVLVDDISFAIDGNTVVAIVEEIIANGSVVYPYLGITSQISSDGQVVASVEEGSPAAEAGMQPGDLIVAVNGETVNAQRGFIDLLYKYEPGDSISFSIFRNGGEVEVTVELGERPKGV